EKQWAYRGSRFGILRSLEKRSRRLFSDCACRLANADESNCGGALDTLGGRVHRSNRSHRDRNDEPPRQQISGPSKIQCRLALALRGDGCVARGHWDVWGGWLP